MTAHPDTELGCIGGQMAHTDYYCPHCLAKPEVIGYRVRPRHHKLCPLGQFMRARGIHPKYRTQQMKGSKA